MPGPSARPRRVSGVIAALLLAAISPLAAERTDVVILKNGDHLTGEVKKLERGRLKLKTDSMGTVYIEWDKIFQITAAETFEARLESGERHVGTFGPGAA